MTFFLLNEKFAGQTREKIQLLKRWMQVVDIKDLTYFQFPLVRLLDEN